MEQKYISRAEMIADIAWLLSQHEITVCEFVDRIAALLEEFDKKET